MKAYTFYDWHQLLQRIMIELFSRIIYLIDILRLKLVTNLYMKDRVTEWLNDC